MNALAWWKETRSVRLAKSTPIDRAIAMGASADRLGLAFLGGYTAAVTALDPAIGVDEIGALCATEDGGGHPRAMQTTLRDGRLNGTKAFVSGGSLATQLLIVARTGEQNDHPVLSVVRVAASQPGVRIEDLPELPFIPEVPHARLVLEDVAAETVLPGDGYLDALKPFRTIEDVHVTAAVIACLVQHGLEHAERATLEHALSLLAALRALAADDPQAPRTHLALAGVLAQSRALVSSMDLSVFAPEFRARLERDRKILSIADTVREKRRQRAWEALSGGRDALW